MLNHVTLLQQTQSLEHQCWNCRATSRNTWRSSTKDMLYSHQNAVRRLWKLHSVHCTTRGLLSCFFFCLFCSLSFPLCLQNSLTRSAPLNSDAQGRSGARFHTSYDKRYVIKTISSEDVAEMHNILKKYHQVKTRLKCFHHDLTVGNMYC